MARILLVLSGGTICTSAGEIGGKKVRKISKKAIALLTKNYYESNSIFAKDVKIVSSPNFNILSENMTIAKWNQLINYLYQKKNSFQEYDGIIVAHGTDTLAYSSSLFSLILCNIGIPVFFVSSNEPLDYPNANGNINFQKAVECICMGIKPNIYVIYKNPSKPASREILLHLGSRLTQCKNYSEDFYSKGCIDISSIPVSQYKDLYRDVTVNEEEYINLNTPWELTNCVLKIDPYVGLNYDAFNVSAFKAILHGTYHSGTVCTERTKENTEYGTQSILHLFDKCRGKTKVYIAPAKQAGDVYESVCMIPDYEDGMISFLHGCTSEMAYVKLLLAYSLNLQDIESFMNTEINAEFAYS